MGESETILCPNPECKFEIQEPIVINDFSTKPKKTYSGCPKCFSEISASTKSVPSQVQKGEQETNPPENEEEETRTPEEKSSQCSKYNEYQESLAKNAPIPEDCLGCPKLLDCSMKR